jgi:hypothetical protein
MIKSMMYCIMANSMIRCMDVMIETLVVKVEVVARCMIKSISMGSFLSTVLKAMEI